MQLCWQLCQCSQAAVLFLNRPTLGRTASSCAVRCLSSSNSCSSALTLACCADTNMAHTALTMIQVAAGHWRASHNQVLLLLLLLFGEPTSMPWMSLTKMCLTLSAGTKATEELKCWHGNSCCCRIAHAHTLNTEAHELLELSYSLGEGLCHLGERGGAAGVLILKHITQGGR